MRRMRSAAFLLVFLCAAVLHAAEPLRIVSLKPSITDTIYALGLGGRLVGVTRYCDVPKGMPAPEIVADYTRPYAERIIALRPDLVLGSEENSSRRSIEGLRQMGIQVELFSFTTIGQMLASIRAIGSLLGASERGERLAASFEDELRRLSAHTAGAKKERTVVVWGIRPLIVAGPGSYMDEILQAVALENAVVGTRIKYPRIGLEQLIAMNPDVIVDLTMDDPSPASVQKRLWDNVLQINAVRWGKVIRMSPSKFRAGPLLVQGLAELAKSAHSE